MLRKVLAIFSATVWISVSEFARNETFLKPFWNEHYQNLGLTFPSEPVNGAIWGVWSLCFAVVLFFLSLKFSYWQSVALGWLAGFALMWLVTWNLLVLPLSILVYALPLSILETVIAVWLLRKIASAD